MKMNRLYYNIKPLLPRRLQIALRSKYAQWKRQRFSKNWPICEEAVNPPENWNGWPEGKKFALVITHDVDTKKGYDNCSYLMDVEEKMGFRSSFNFVALRYEVSTNFLANLDSRGFEIGNHGLYHDGKLFSSREAFIKRASKINEFIRKWNSVGFRSPAMLRNFELIGKLNIEYDLSSFDTDPFEPESEGMGTIFPFVIETFSKKYVEIPYTIPQDFTIFILLKENSIDIWKRKIKWIAENGGLAVILTHPDYIAINGNDPTREEYPLSLYEEFLRHIKTVYPGEYWHVLPKKMARYWAINYPLTVRNSEKKMRIGIRRGINVGMLSYSFYDTDARVARYAETLSQRGDQVDVITLGRPGQAKYEVMNGVHVFRIQSRERNEKNRINYLTRIIKFIRRSSSLIHQRHRMKPYDVIHVHSVPDFQVFGAWYAKFKGAHIILDIHDIVPEFYVSKFNNGKESIIYKFLLIIEKLSVRFSDHVIISNHLWQKKIQRSLNGNKCSVFMNCPDPRIFHKRSSRKKDGKFIILYPGSLNWHQGVDIAIKGFYKICDQVPNAELHIYGDGDEKPALSEMIRKMGAQKRVFLYNEVPREKMAEIMANADLGIVPKRNSYFGGEAFSTKTLEFMALGVPLLVSSTMIDTYYFNDSVVKFFNPEDVEDLSNKLFLLANDQNMREKMAERASAFVSEFMWDKKSMDYIKLIDSLAANKDAGLKGMANIKTEESEVHQVFSLPK